MDEFRKVLAEAVGRYGGRKKDLANAVGVSPSTISHWLSTCQMRNPPGTDFCLRLAHVTGLSPSRVLRAAGRSHVADMVEELYGPTRPTVRPRGIDLKPAEEQVAMWLRSLDPTQRRAFGLLIKAAAVGMKVLEQEAPEIRKDA